MGCPDAGRFDLISYDVPARRNATYLDVERWEWRERDARCFSCPSNREIWGRVDCEKMRESARANLRESVKFRRLKTAQAYGIRAKRKRGYLYLSLSLFLALCVMADDETSTSLDVASHTNEYSIFQDRRGVCCKQGFVSDVETGFKSLELFFLNIITLLVYIGKRLERCQVELQFLSDRIVSLNNSRIWIIFLCLVIRRIRIGFLIV